MGEAGGYGASGLALLPFVEGTPVVSKRLSRGKRGFRST